MMTLVRGDGIGKSWVLTEGRGLLETVKPPIILGENLSTVSGEKGLQLGISDQKAWWHGLSGFTGSVGFLDTTVGVLL